MPGNENEFRDVTLSASSALSCGCSKESILFDVVLLMSHQRVCGSCISWFSAKPPAKHPSSESDILKCASQTPICRLLNATKLKTALFERK